LPAAEDIPGKKPAAAVGAGIPKSPPLDAERRKALEGYMPDFLAEFTEQIDALEDLAHKLETNRQGAEQVNAFFRIVHTIKGTANALGFLALGYLCHKVESALAVYREKKIPLPRHLQALLFEFNNALGRYKSSIAAMWTDSEVDVTHLLARLEPSMPEDGRTPGAGEKAQEPSPQAPDSNPLAITSHAEKIGAIRVDVERLDNMMNAVGELALLRNKTQKMAEAALAAEGSGLMTQYFHTLAGELDSVTRRLHHSIMRARMLPVGSVFNRFTRLARDLSAALGKEVDLQITGAETEMDKNLLEAISDPLLHIIRNCVDHGIEPPDEREKQGKPRRGSVGLGARQERNSIVIEIFDDGKGIDRKVLAQKAVERGIISAEKVDRLSRAEAMALIFHPGVSTAPVVTDVSGRGVGMDVVKTNIEKLNGNIEIASKPGVGTRIRLRLPLTLTVMPVLICRAGAGTIGFPLFSVEETIRVDSGQIQDLPGGPALRLRERTLPLLRAAAVLELENGGQTQGEKDVVVVRAASRRFGFVVDKVLGHEDILLKPLDSLRGIFHPPFLTGATILGDGNVAFILDVFRIVSTVSTAHIEGENRSITRKQAEPEELTLVFEGGGTHYGASVRWIGGVAASEETRFQPAGVMETAMLAEGPLPVMRIGGGESLGGEPYLIILHSGGRRAGLMANGLSGLFRIPARIFKSGGKSAQAGGMAVTLIDPARTVDSILAGGPLQL